MRRASLIVPAMAVCLGLVTPAFAGSVGAVRSRLMQAREYADHNRKDDATDKLDEAEKFLDGLTDEEKAPLVKDIAALRATLSGGTAPAAAGGAPAGAGAAPAADAADPEASARIERSVARVLGFAEGEGNPSAAANQIEQAVTSLDSDDAKKNLSPDARAKLQARIDALRAKLKSANNREASSRFVDRVERDIRAGADAAERDPRFARTRLDESDELLASDEAHQKLDVATIARLRKSLAEGNAAFAAADKKDALGRAMPNVEQLEAKLATDPYKGVDPGMAYRVDEDVGGWQSRAMYEARRIPDGDADRKSIEDRLAAAQTKMDGYAATFAAANVEAGVVNNWKIAAGRFAGWDAETAPSGGPAFKRLSLEKTEVAARDAKEFLDEKEAVAAKAQAAKMPGAAAAIAEAEHVATAAATKLDAAFNAWMDDAEKQPRPQGQARFDIGVAADMGRWADSKLAGTSFHDADVARAKKLDDRWQSELAALKKQREDALRTMTAAADAAWPKIVASVPAQSDFRPTSAAASVGKTFRFPAVRNRAGWDFDGRYDLVMWIDGQPVAGTYDPKIAKAFADAAGQIGDSVDDHIDWDVIATIEGAGQVNQRTTTEVKDEHLNLLGKIEGTRPIDCTIVRVIAVHAGPVAASAK